MNQEPQAITSSQLESATSAAAFVAARIGSYIGGPAGQAAANLLVGDLAWGASTTDLLIKMQNKTATWEDVAQVTLRTETFIASVAVLGGVAGSVPALAAVGIISAALFTWMHRQEILDALTTGGRAVENTINDTLVEIENGVRSLYGIPNIGHLPRSTIGIDGSVGTSFDLAQRPPRRDPLMLDLNGDGEISHTGTAQSSAYFDHDLDGVRTKTGWVTGGDGLLVLDVNGNGTIDNGSELFGDHFTKTHATAAGAAGQFARDGFDALASLDTNADGYVDAADAQFAQLKVWVDANGDGISQAGELRSLAAATTNAAGTPVGITRFNVTPSAVTTTNTANGNQTASLVAPQGAAFIPTKLLVQKPASLAPAQAVAGLLPLARVCRAPTLKYTFGLNSLQTPMPPATNQASFWQNEALAQSAWLYRYG